MKTRKQVIEEILAQNRLHPITEKQAALEFALKGLQDALLFQLAADLKISLEVVQS